jgi:hypothetical protein
MCRTLPPRGFETWGGKLTFRSRLWFPFDCFLESLAGLACRYYIDDAAWRGGCLVEHHRVPSKGLQIPPTEMDDARRPIRLITFFSRGVLGLSVCLCICARKSLTISYLKVSEDATDKVMLRAESILLPAEFFVSRDRS